MQQDDPADRWLMSAIAAGDERALGLLYDRYHQKVFQVALSRLRDPGLAEEVVDDVFMRCWEQAATFRHDSVSARAWLCRITDNRAIDIWRGRQSQARRREHTLPDRETGADAVDLAARVADQVTVADCLDTLPAAQQEVIRYAYFGGLTQSEIAEVTLRPLGTVKTQTRAALEALRRCVGGPHGDGSVLQAAP